MPTAFISWISSSAREGEIRSSQPGHALDEIMADVDNEHAAWQHAIGQHRFDLIERCCTGLNASLMLYGMHVEALGHISANAGSTAERSQKALNGIASS